MLPSVAGNLNSFAIIVGKCVWVPPSAKAAVIFVTYFFGALPSITADIYEYNLTQRFISAGMTTQEVEAELKRLNDCIGTYVVPPQNSSNKLDGSRIK